MKKKIVICLAVFMLFVSVLGSSYIYAEGKEPEKTQEEATEEIKEDTPKEVGADVINGEPTIEEHKDKDPVKETEEKPTVLSVNANEAAPVATNNAGPYQIEGKQAAAVAEDGWMYNDPSGSINIWAKSSGDYTIIGDGIERTGRLVVQLDDDVHINLTIKDINMSYYQPSQTFLIDKSSTSHYNSSLSLNIEGVNKFTTTAKQSDVVIREKYIVGIFLPTEINGTGSLQASAPQGSELGGIEIGNKVTINGGTIIAESDGIATGIGASDFSKSVQGDTSLTINGGTITANAQNGAGIGISGDAGAMDDFKDITINGGTVVASSENGAGIGTGYGDKLVTANVDCNKYIERVTINGGNVTATSTNGAGIGAGRMPTTTSGYNYQNIVDNITINGGTVTAASTNGAGIGSGEASDTVNKSMVNNISITGGNVTATSTNGAGIGGGQGAGSTVGSISSTGPIMITGGTITAESKNAPSDIGNGQGASDYAAAVWIHGGSVYTSRVIKPAPYYSNSNRKQVYVGELPNQSGVTSVKVDSVDYKISGNHPTSNSFYLYMTGQDHYVTITDSSGNKKTVKAIWNASNSTFTFSTDDVNAGDLIVEGGTKGTDWVYNSSTNQVDIKKAGTYHVYSIVDTTSQGIIVTSTNGIVNFTIHDLNMVGGNIQITGSSGAKLMLAGTNDIDVYSSADDAVRSLAGVQVESSSRLEIAGDGSLNIVSAIGAGIGGYYQKENGPIAITSGTINTRSSNGAGIGGGSGAAGKNITINGGNITTLTTYGAGIGGGYGSSGQDINITGGTVSTTSYNGHGIGIGAAGTAAVSNNIYIGGGSVKAKGYQKNISVTPKNSAAGNQEVALYELKNQSSVNTIKIDNVSYTLAGYHDSSDTSYYLYMTKEEHTIICGLNTYNVAWDATNSVFKQKAPKPATPTTSVTANSITVTAPSDTATYGAAQYSINGTTWQTSNTFSNLKAATNYTVYVKYTGNADYMESDAVSKAVTTSSASYTITIPSTVTAGGTSQNISVNTAQSFVLGYGGQVNVKVTSGMTSAGIMTLTRTTGTVKPTISSQFKVNNANFTNTNNNVATFKTKTDTAVPISFATPTHTSGVVPAGVYSGTVVFTMTYSQ